jgi:hypothetical protein
MKHQHLHHNNHSHHRQHLINECKAQLLKHSDAFSETWINDLHKEYNTWMQLPILEKQN